MELIENTINKEMTKESIDSLSELLSSIMLRILQRNDSKKVLAENTRENVNLEI